MKTQLTRVFIGYNNKKKNYKDPKDYFCLYKVHFQDSQLKLLSKKVGFKTYHLPTLSKSSEDPTREQSAFSITTGITDGTVRNNYYTELVVTLYNYICNNDKNIESLKNLDNLNKCKYVIYVGYRYQLNDKHQRINKSPMLAVFPFKAHFEFTRKKKSGFFLGPYNGKYFKFVSNKNLFQLPFNKSDNIIDFCRINNKRTNKGKKTDNDKDKKSNYNFELRIYNPSKFDNVLDTDKLKTHLAEDHVKGFDNGDMELAKNSIKVHFTDENVVINVINKKHKNKKDRYLVDNMATYTGNKNSTVQKATIPQVKNVLYILRRSLKNQKYPFHKKDIPKLDYSEEKDSQGHIHYKNGKLSIGKSENSVLIFCSLLKNKIVEKLLNKHIYMPGF